MGAVLLALSAVPPREARAELWTLDSHLESRLESDDNFRLEARATRADTLALGGSLGLQREGESARTSLDTTGTLFATRPAGERPRADLAVAFSHAQDGPRDHATLGLRWQRQSNAEQRTQASEVGLGSGERTQLGASAGWTHHFSERDSASVSWNTSATRYASESPGAVDYRNWGWTAGVTRRISELDSVGAQLDGSGFRSDDGSTSSSGSGYGLFWQRALDERASLSLSLGREHTSTSAERALLVCPLPQSFCAAGLVNYILALTPGRSSRTSTQFQATTRYSAAPTLDLQAAASREVTPTGVGSVARNDALSLGASLALCETWRATASAAWSRSQYLGTDRAPPQLRTLVLSTSSSLSEDLVVEATVRHTRSDAGSGSGSVSSRALGLALRWHGPRRYASR